MLSDFIHDALVNVEVLSEQGKRPRQQRGGRVMPRDEHGQHLVADDFVGETGVDQVLQIGHVFSDLSGMVFCLGLL
jgi:hypothetical protein